MTTPNETKMPERLEVEGTILSWDGVAEIQVHGDELTHNEACKLATELARRWNAHSVLSRLADYTQHAPVCRGPGAACDCGLKELLEELEKPTL